MNEQENIDDKIKTNRKNTFLIMVTLIISGVILAVLIKLIFANSKINQGKYRVSDAIITSGTEFVDKSKETGTWMYDVYQKNLLSLLVSSNAEISRVYISDIYSDKSDIEIRQQDSDLSVYANENLKLDLASSISDDGDVLYEISITNKNALNNFNISDEITEIKHDASIFKLANITNADLKFSISFNFNIQEKSGKVSTMKVKLNLPYEDMIENGASVTRLDVGDLVFKFK